MALLIAILVCCLAGVTVIREERAWTLIFNTLWFNGLLVLLVVNIAFCFFPRMWGRRVTFVSFGMILFHISFVAILCGVIYNSLFYFRGLIRLTEGEALQSADPKSYDTIDKGRFFDISKIKGETSLVRMHRDYKVSGEDKRAAYEIVVGEGITKKQGIIYITRSLEHNGFSYFNDREGYSLLVLLSDRHGNEFYGAHVPLQSLRQKDESYLYATGTKAGPSSFAFPQPPAKPLFALQTVYLPSKLTERGGEVFFRLWPLHKVNDEADKPLAEGKAAIGAKFDAGDYTLSVKEVRYWVGMNVRHDPGKPIVLSSLWVGFAGMVITFMGRLRRNRKQSTGN